ncbi:purine-nucleoside phosphorylase [Sporobolomyces salmoneus]|uniref:purine-nucleoside phosphorylase n=1 Tax=Sporobolomyces salmoneus TaxID=183962 RepID=UPI00316F457B
MAGSPSTDSPDALGRSDSTSSSPFIVQTSPTRPRANVGMSSEMPALDDARPLDPDENSITRDGSLVASSCEHPLSKSAFLVGLKWTGYLEPLDTSRNKIKQRYNHFLDKQHFKANLYAFLENAGVERLGESMVRFVGTKEPHSPYVGVYIKSAIESRESVKIYASVEPTNPDSSSSIRPSSTQWTFLLAEEDGMSCEWACKAKRFWPVRVRFEGSNPPSSSTAVVPSAPPTRPRGKRRDTFQREIDLDAELRRSEQTEEEEAQREKERLKLNTTKNSARPSNSPAIEIDTKNTAPVEPPLEERPQRTPTTPTVLESAKQLRDSIVASLPPSMQQLPTVMQNRLRQWFDGPEGGASRGGRDYEEEEEEYLDSEEERRRREQRNRRRERRRRREEERELQERLWTQAIAQSRSYRVYDRGQLRPKLFNEQNFLSSPSRSLPFPPLPSSAIYTMHTQALRTLLAASVLSTAFAAPANKNDLVERDEGVVTPKVMIVSTFTPERDVWIEPSQLYNNISFLGASPMFPDVACDRGLERCLVTTGEGSVNAASTIMALTLSPKFDLRQTYFLIAGIAGINPEAGTLGSAAWARFVVQAGIAYELDSRELPSNWTDPADPYWAIGTTRPGELPDVSDLYGTEVFELNTNLLDRIYNLTKDLQLNDSTEAMNYRQQYPSAPANQPPSVVLGDAICSDTYYYASLSGTWERYLNMMTLGQGKYATTASEDSATLESLVRADDAGLVDYSRVMVLRTASDFDRPPNATTDAYDAFYENQAAGGFDPATQNLQIVGSVIVEDIIASWDALYAGGIAPQSTENGSFYGDDIATLRPNGTAQARSKFRRSFLPVS